MAAGSHDRIFNDAIAVWYAPFFVTELTELKRIEVLNLAVTRNVIHISIFDDYRVYVTL